VCISFSFYSQSDLTPEIQSKHPWLIYKGLMLPSYSNQYPLLRHAILKRLDAPYTITIRLSVMCIKPRAVWHTGNLQKHLSLG
jgi:hypothetical protein